jgi:hypothetical protein
MDIEDSVEFENEILAKNFFLEAKGRLINITYQPNMTAKKWILRIL